MEVHQWFVIFCFCFLLFKTVSGELIKIEELINEKPFTPIDPGIYNVLSTLQLGIAWFGAFCLWRMYKGVTQNGKT